MDFQQCHGFFSSPFLSQVQRLRLLTPYLLMILWFSKPLRFRFLLFPLFWFRRSYGFLLWLVGLKLTLMVPRLAPLLLLLVEVFSGNVNHICIFSYSISLGNALFAEIMASFMAMEYALSRSCNDFWFESDSKLVIKAYTNFSLFRWKLRNRWDNRITNLKSSNFLATHMNIEGNKCADTLANLALTFRTYTIWIVIHSNVYKNFNRNYPALPNFRIFISWGFDLIPSFLYLFSFLLYG